VNIPILSGHCEVAQRIAERIGLPEDVRESLGQIYERWDGKGLPRGLSGNAVKFPVRVVTMAQDAIALNDHHGFAAMREMIAKRAGGGYEPELVDTFLTNAEKLLAGLDGPVDRATILALEPEPRSMLDEEACEQAYLAIADMIDMRMPATFGHSRAVASLAAAAAGKMALPASDVRDVRRAAYAHDIGELTVPVSTWMRAGPLTERETDEAQPSSLSRRACARVVGWQRQSCFLARATSSRAAGRQRLLPQRKGPDLSPAARILAAAEAFQTAREARPYRLAMSDSAAALKLRAAVKKALPRRRRGSAHSGWPTRAQSNGRAARGFDAARNRGFAADRGRRYRKGGRPQARYRAEDRRQPHPEPLFEDQRHHPGGGGALCSRAGLGSAPGGIGNSPHVRG
jgi:HD-GYP domain-containing protein (c-di-GMP phosphodiesterase class II)